MNEFTEAMAGNVAVAVGDIAEPLVSELCDHASTLSVGATDGNGASIFTRDGYDAREFKQHFNAGMIGINVGVPAPMAWFPFTGWNQSFFGDLHLQGTESVHFYTRQKTTLTRWFQSSESSHVDPVWKTSR